MNKKSILTLIIILLIIIGITFVIKDNKKEVKEEPKTTKVVKQKKKEKELTSKEYNKFDISLIRESNKNYKNENYLISPYSIEIALNMLKEGANNNTYKEINNLLPNRSINDVSIKNKIGVANGLFISNRYDGRVEKDFINKLTNDYSSDVIYDEFKTPDKINNWVKEKTKNMIPKLLNDMSPDFVLGLANALAIDVEWYNQFDCIDTSEYTFKINDNKKMDVEMMYQEYRNKASYFETDNAKGVVIPYKKYNKSTGEEIYEENVDGSTLEFIAILPNDDLDKYITNLTEDELNSIDKNNKIASYDEKISLHIPRFGYDFNLNDFMEVLSNLGIKDAFDSTNADFTKMVSKEKRFGNIYVGEAIHKTHIELNEKGTKAAAVTYFGMYDNALAQKETKTIEITFDKPFAYIIRDKKTNELLFFGTVYEPNKWRGSTCSDEN